MVLLNGNGLGDQDGIELRESESRSVFSQCSRVQRAQFIARHCPTTHTYTHTHAAGAPAATCRDQLTSWVRSERQIVSLFLRCARKQYAEIACCKERDREGRCYADTWTQSYCLSSAIDHLSVWLAVCPLSVSGFILIQCPPSSFGVCLLEKNEMKWTHPAHVACTDTSMHACISDW